MFILNTAIPDLFEKGCKTKSSTRFLTALVRFAEIKLSAMSGEVGAVSPFFFFQHTAMLLLSPNTIRVSMLSISKYFFKPTLILFQGGFVLSHDFMPVKKEETVRKA